MNANVLKLLSRREGRARKLAPQNRWIEMKFSVPFPVLRLPASTTTATRKPALRRQSNWRSNNHDSGNNHQPHETNLPTAR
jgi:hypothetical protein